jgi:hypothetical protein
MVSRRRAHQQCSAVSNRPVIMAVAALAIGAGAAQAEPDAPPRDPVMRVESELFADDGDAPVARSLTLFRDGVAWDFLELPTDDDAGALRLTEIVLHDPARGRVVVIDVVRNVKTQVESVRLERLSVSLASWARGEDDRLVRWAGGPDFEAGLTETETTLELGGPRVRYAVAHAPAPSPEAAAAYREFADTALLLRALLQPGGLPPFPRLALNGRLEAAGAIPCEVTLEIASRFSSVGGRAEKLTCRHRLHPRLLGQDEATIDDAAARSAAARPVALAAFVERAVSDAD